VNRPGLLCPASSTISRCSRYSGSRFFHCTSLVATPSRYSSLVAVDCAARRSHVLIASGLINSWYLVGAFAALLGTLYGRLLLVKLSLFFGMLVLAAANASGSSRP
jgi:putative copper export protein